MQITWLLCGHGLESNQGKFILDSKMDWQPVEVGENWCDMITPTRPGYNTCDGVLNLRLKNAQPIS